jgi:tetratricopeptide (TPR) repeat protein
MMLLGRLEETRRSFAEAMQLLEIESFGETPLWFCIVDGKAAALTGICESATERSARSFELAERLDNDFAYAVAYYELGMYHYTSRDWNPAIDALKHCLDVQTTALFKPTALAHCAQALLETGDVEKADRYSRAAVDYSLTNGYRWDPEPYFALARVSMARKDCDQAIAALDDFEKQIEDTGARAFLPFLHEGRAEFSQVFESDWSRDRELLEAKRLFEEFGAAGHAQRVASLLE